MTGQIALLLLLTALTHVCCASDDPKDALKRAQELSSLTGSHAKPFHIRLTVSEPANSASPYRATIEEIWQSPKLWQRTIDSRAFKQNLIVKDGVSSEQNSGDYYPIWLRSFVTASIDPLEGAIFWEQVSARIVQTNSTNGVRSSSCARAQFKIGTAAQNNDAFAVICFNSDGTLSSVVRPGYDMEFHDQRVFGKKRIAYRYVDDPEPGTELVGSIDALEEIPTAASLPGLSDLADSSPDSIKSVPINQETVGRLLSSSFNLVWPTVHSGNTSGKLSMYISADREGHVREAYPLNSDNAGLQDAARDQLLKWQFKAAMSDGKPVQVEAALTFAFSTSLDQASAPSDSGAVPPSIAAAVANPIKVSPQIANSLRTKVFAPVYPQSLRERRVGGSVHLQAVLGKNGEVISLVPIDSSNPEFTKAAIAAVSHWSYKPYLLNGSPVEIETVITVNFAAP